MNLPNYNHIKFKERLSFSDSDLISIFLTLYRLIEFPIIAYTQGLIALSKEDYIPKNEVSLIASVFREISDGTEQSEFDIIIKEIFTDERIRGRALVEACLIYETLKSLKSNILPFYAFSGQLSLIFPESKKEIINFTFHIFELLCIKHDFSREYFQRIKQIKNGYAESDASLFEIIKTQRTENETARKVKKIPGGIPSPTEMEELFVGYKTEMNQMFDAIGGGLSSDDIDALLGNQNQ